jgi:hypothetical protein
MHFAQKSPTMAYMPQYLAGYAGCGCDMGMVSPANIATLGAMELGRSVYSYDRAIARVKAKIKLLKKKKARAKLNARKRVLQARIARLRAKLQKLKAYKKIRQQKKLDKQGGADIAISEEEDLLLQDAMSPEPAIDPMELQSEEQMMIANEGGMDWTKIAVFGGLAVLGVFGAKMFFKKKKAPRKNRLKMGAKSNPKRRKAKRKVVRRKRK